MEIEHERSLLIVEYS
jgi:hypothetical protein